MNTPKVFREMVGTLAKSGETILEEMNPHDFRLLTTGIFNGIQAGERVDDIKKQVIYQKDQGINLPKFGELPEGLTAEKMHLIHMAMGVFGEAAELLDAVFGHVEHNKPLDMHHVEEELGDVEFYMEGLRQGLALDREDILQSNIKKLGERYKGFIYSDEAAQKRADKLNLDQES